MSEDRNYLDFEIIKEEWNKYSLSDNSKLKTRAILKSAWFKEKDKNKNYSFDIENYSIIMCDPSLQENKEQPTYTKEQVEQNIEIPSCRYATVAYEANEYILDDGTKIVIHLNLRKISRTKLYSKQGDRRYLVDVQMTVNVEPTKS